MDEGRKELCFLFAGDSQALLSWPDPGSFHVSFRTSYPDDMQPESYLS